MNDKAYTNQDEIITQSFNVKFEFPVCFTKNIFSPENSLLVDILRKPEPDKRHRIVIFVDEGVFRNVPGLENQIENYCDVYHDNMDLARAPISMPAGEKLKSELHFIEQMQRVIHECRIDRHSYVIGLGGGALLDAVGLVAATTHRGIRHVRIPTTVLAQNDSGVGVKNGVNLFGQKNYFGTFTPPFAVINDYQFISYLSKRDKMAGMAEAVKVALIRDLDFYHWLEANSRSLAAFEPSAMSVLIRRCAELHMYQIAHGGDPFETGSARPLDFGHWSAHRLETLTRFQLRHGEAVAIGLALDTHYSVLAGMLSDGVDQRLCWLLENIGFKLWHPALALKNKNGRFEILEGLSEFREHLGGELTITMLTDIGKGQEVHEINEHFVLESIKWLKRRFES